MSKHIIPIKDTHIIWNERFAQALKSQYPSQRDFSKEYKARFQRGGNQADISNWMHVGEIDGDTGKKRGFPSFETMANIASILDVSVGYLIGETDYETFELEKASKYASIAPEAMKAIRDLTLGKSIPPFHKYPDFNEIAALELFLTSPFLVEYLKNISEYAIAINNEKLHETSENISHSFFDRAFRNIPEKYRSDACKLCELETFGDSDDESKISAMWSEEVQAFANILSDANEEDMNQEYYLSLAKTFAESKVYETHRKLLTDIVSDNHINEFLKKKWHLTEEQADFLFSDHKLKTRTDVP